MPCSLFLFVCTLSFTECHPDQCGRNGNQSAPVVRQQRVKVVRDESSTLSKKSQNQTVQCPVTESERTKPKGNVDDDKTFKDEHGRAIRQNCQNSPSRQKRPHRRDDCARQNPANEQNRNRYLNLVPLHCRSPSDTFKSLPRRFNFVTQLLMPFS